MEHWSSPSFQIYHALEFSNTYFSTKNQFNEHRSSPFSNAVDPDKALSNAIDQNHIHTEENEVKYFECYGKNQQVESTTQKIANKDIYYRYRITDPAIFYLGDIVEAQISLQAEPVPGELHKLTMILRAITLIQSKGLKVRWVQK